MPPPQCNSVRREAFFFCFRLSDAPVPDDCGVGQPYVGSYKKKETRTNRTVAFVPDDGDVVQGNADEPHVGSYKKETRTVAFVPDDGDVVQGNADEPCVDSCRKRKTVTKRTVAFVPGDGDVVQGNAVEPYVGSYKRTFWSNRINEVVQGDAICACRLGRR